MNKTPLNSEASARETGAALNECGRAPTWKRIILVAIKTSPKYRLVLAHILLNIIEIL